VLVLKRRVQVGDGSIKDRCIAKVTRSRPAVTEAEFYADAGSIAGDVVISLVVACLAATRSPLGVVISCSVACVVISFSATVACVVFAGGIAGSIA
jgi:hypothetical protein